MIKGGRIILKFILICFAAVFIFASACAAFLFKYGTDLKNAEPFFVTEEKKESAKREFYKKINFKPQHVHLNSVENFLPVKNNLNLNAASYILLDAKTGTIILQHNENKVIPPASLTKLAAIYTLMKNKKFQDGTKIVKPPKEAWAVFLPPNSAELGLGKAQQLSIKELLLGMSVCSGNDAALAAAIIAEGSSEKFVNLMNYEMKNLGLEKTYFTEPTGLSEKNKTTAKEFAAFSLRYVNTYPDNLKQLHSIGEIEYPCEHNMIIKKNKNGHIVKYSPVKKLATNTLLKKIKGCDGLKTGFIYESGFNISLTAERNGMRFIAVILGGEGSSISEGISIREKNGIKIMDFAFDNFKTADISKENIINKKIIVLGSELKANRSAVKPILACTDFSENHLTLFKDDEKYIEKIIELPQTVNAPLYAGQRLGQITYKIKNSSIILKTIPLICPADIKAGSEFRKKIDKFLMGS
ncbi:D-alanyl-D-alanine carboxypeptidase family protein [Treponema pedis]|uniref:D-alanyl-D-alanine carboxypeptidase family protein n=1 Tax=Treponema pedis TaxID=409322 RepID=UPI00040CEEAB|nr:D-alanyl-D-alanine carboxypeptidase [Treponema pedis]